MGQYKSKRMRWDERHFFTPMWIQYKIQMHVMKDSSQMISSSTDIIHHVQCSFIRHESQTEIEKKYSKSEKKLFGKLGMLIFKFRIVEPFAPSSFLVVYEFRRFPWEIELNIFFS